MKKLILLFIFSPSLLLGQEQIWHKTKTEVVELIIGEWKMVSWTFEGQEQEMLYDIAIESYESKSDTFNLFEIHNKNKKTENILPHLSSWVEKLDSGFYLCIDYTVKHYCRQIIYIDNKKLILEEGPYIQTFKRLTSTKNNKIPLAVDYFMPPIEFEPKSCNITNMDHLNSLADAFIEHDSLNIKIIGNATSKELKLNPDLSNKRAFTVFKYLVEKGIMESRLAIKDVKDTQPRDPDEKRNAYVEIIIISD